MRRMRLNLVLALVVVVPFAGCGGSSPAPVQPITIPAGSGTVFLVGTDAPLPSLLAFQVMITGLTVSDGSTTVPVWSEPADVEFARLLGLRTLLGLESVPAGTYTSATLTLATPRLHFLDLATTPASVGTLEGSLTRSSVTVPLQPPLTVSEGGLAGLHLHFLLRDSIQTDAAGELTGVVDPHIRLRAIPPEVEDSFIDELRGGVSSVDVAGSLFILQTRRGRPLTIRVDDETIWEEGENLDTLEPPAAVEISGHVRADGSLLATSVEVLTREAFLLGGLVLDPDPPLGPAARATLLVRQEIPDLADIQVGRTATVDFQDHTRFDIHNINLPLEFLIFNRGALIRGQRVTMGGRIDATTEPERLRIGRVVLHRQGFEGRRVPGSVRIVSGNNGSFLLRTRGLFGLLFSEPLRVVTSNRTRFVDLEGLASLEGLDPVRLRVVGLLLHDPGRGEPVLVAKFVQQLQPSLL